MRYVDVINSTRSSTFGISLILSILSFKESTWGPQRKYVFDLLTEMGKLGAKPNSTLISKNGELFHDPER